MSLHGRMSPNGRKVDIEIMLLLKNDLKNEWKDLGRALHFSEEELQKLKNENQDEEEELAYYVLLNWTRKENGSGTVKALLNCLTYVYRPDLVHKILELISSPDRSSPSIELTTKNSRPRARGILGWISQQHQIDHNLGKLRKSLMDEFRNLTVQGLPLINLRIQESYVDLMLHSFKEAGSKTSEPLLLEDIFQSHDDGKPCRILIEGHSGYGKTTLAYKMCYDWAIRNCTYISHFDAVVLLPLRQFARIPFDNPLKALDDFLLSATLNIWEETDTPWAIIQDQSKRILFLLDGFDEIDKEHADIISELLWRDTLTHVTMIVTAKSGTGPNPEDAMKSEAANTHGNSKPSWHRKIKIKGIAPDEKRVEFVGKYSKSFIQKSQLEKSSKQADSYLESDAYACPLILLMTAVISTEGTDQIQSKTDWYKGYYKAVASRYCVENSIKDFEPDDLFCEQKPRNKHMAEIRIQLDKLGKISFDVLQQTQMRYFAWESLFHKIEINPNIYKFGLFPKNSSLEDFFSEPIHTSLLEFAIAYHLSATYGGDDWTEKVRLFKPKYGSSTSYIIPFLKDLMGERSSDLLQAIGCNDVEYSQCFDIPGFNIQLGQMG